MNGQWIGQYTGTSTGHITLNLELVNNLYHGIAILIDHSQGPSFTITVDFDKADENNLQAKLSNFLPIHPITLLPDTWENVKNSFPTFSIPKEGLFTGSVVNKNSLKGKWNTDINTNGELELSLSDTSKPSPYQPTVMTWEKFKSHVTTLEKNQYVFRGQPNNSRLRTSFHRTGRSNLYRYELQNIPELHRHICAQSGKLFNTRDALEYGALLNLAQHHGYPTPLLDWTRSPYIAAYFAFSALSENKSNNVRIYIFKSVAWRKETIMVSHLSSPVLTITPLELMPINNNRALPQQSVTTFTNVNDMESFISQNEKRNNETYLEVIDIPISEKYNAMQDLNYMGVSASALLPGLDGTCKTLKETHFNFDGE